jgi:myo-inositol 2-dehydrogenase / D-chiro-inositol 1-dehydrogenase
VRIGLIGLGRIGAFHAETLSALDIVEELVVTDAVASVAQQTAQKVSATLADTPKDVLASGVDGVVIAASTPTHPTLVRAAVQAGLPTFCEKPVAQDPREGAKVLARVEGSDVPVQIGFPRRFDPAFVAVRADVVAGRLGWLHTVRSTTLDPGPPPEAYLRASGGIFHDCAVHDFDAVRWVTGREVVEVYAAGGNRGESFIREAGDADTVASVLTLDDGTLAVVSNTRHNGRGYDVRLEVHGSLDAVAAGFDDTLPLRSADLDVHFPAGEPATFFMDRMATAFRQELEAFTHVVAGELASPCTVADGLAASWVAEAATLSWRERRPVRVEEVRTSSA